MQAQTTHDTDDTDETLVVQPVAILSRMFSARPSAIPDIRDFVEGILAESPLTPDGKRELHAAVLNALLESANAETLPNSIQVSFRIFPEYIEVDVLRSIPESGEPQPLEWSGESSFTEWIGAYLRRRNLSQEAAARQLGVSVKTIGRWVRGETKPRLTDMRRILEVFGQLPPS